MTWMQTLADEQAVDGLINGLAGAITADVSRSTHATGWALVGLRNRGDILAHRLAGCLDAEAFADRVGVLDITLYRDDLSEVSAQPVVRTTDIPFAVDGLDIVLVDDVLMTGRTIRAALQSLMDLGRPRRVWLSVLVDRGGRELPIRPDHLALDLSGDRIAQGDQVEVRLKPTDDRDAVVIRHRGTAQGDQR